MDKQTQTKKEKGRFFEKYGWIFALVSGFIAICFLFGQVVKTKVDGAVVDVHLWDYFMGLHPFDWSMYVTVGLLMLGIIFMSLHLVNPTFDSVASMLFILAIPLLALSREFYDCNEIEGVKASFGWGAACSIGFTVSAALLSLSAHFVDRPITIREIAEDGILIAAAIILNFIKIPLGPSGGSINFQMLPLMLIALRHGPTHGLICGGIIYGLVTCLIDGWGFATYPFDYLIGFGSVMVIGLFNKFILGENQKWYNLKGEIFLLIGGILSTFVRFVGSTASSMIVYGYTFVAAAAYNAIYIPVSGAIAIAMIMASYGPVLKVHNLFPVKKSV